MRGVPIVALLAILEPQERLPYWRRTLYQLAHWDPEVLGFSVVAGLGFSMRFRATRKRLPLRYSTSFAILDGPYPETVQNTKLRRKTDHDARSRVAVGARQAIGDVLATTRHN
jgi:hypothetical protein